MNQDTFSKKEKIKLLTFHRNAYFFATVPMVLVGVHQVSNCRIHPSFRDTFLLFLVLYTCAKGMKEVHESHHILKLMQQNALKN